MLQIEFLFLSSAKLMVLERMSLFATVTSDRSRWRALAGKVLMASVVLGNAVGVVASAIAAANFTQSARLSQEAYAYFLAKESEKGRQSAVYGREKNDDALEFTAVQSFAEVFTLLLIVMSFFVVGFACFRRISSALKSLAPESDRSSSSSTAAASGRQLRLQILGLTCLIFVAFLIRSVFSSMLAIANAESDSASLCARGKGSTSGFCDPCFNMYITRYCFHCPIVPFCAVPDNVLTPCSCTRTWPDGFLALPNFNRSSC
jgi:hypothetical protein